MIEDEELRITFKDASEEHLQKLDEGLLHLEKYPDDLSGLNELMREAHSLKGDANMLGIKDVGTLAHQLEHILGTIKRSEASLTPALCDRLSGGLNAIRQLVREAVTGEPSGINTFYALAHLMGADTQPPKPLQVKEETVEIIKPTPETKPAPAAPTHTSEQESEVAAQQHITHPRRETPDRWQNHRSPIPNPQLPTPAENSQLISGQKSHRYIEDDELRTTFKIVCEEHLQKLDRGLLFLEKFPNDNAKLEEMLREAHSIKGDAGMLGVKDVGTLAHQLENIFTAVKLGELSFTSALCDNLSYGLDGIRQLVHEAVTGEPTGTNPADVLARMSPIQQTSPSAATLVPTLAEDGNMIAASSSAAPTDRMPAQVLQTPNITANQQPQPLTGNGYFSAAPVQPAATGLQFPPPTDAVKISSDTYRIETIRVETRNLDALMTQAGELTVAKIRIAHRLGEIEQIVSLWEEWSRDVFVNRFALDELERGLKVEVPNGRNSDINPKLAGNFHLRPSARNGTLKQVQNLHHRAEERLEQLGSLVNRLRNAVYEDTARLDTVADELEEGIRTLRLLPLSTIFNLFPRMVRDLARQQSKEVELVIEGGETKADKRILEEMKDPLMHILRNAIDHGIETPAERLQMGKPPVATIRLRGYQTATNIIIEVADDGRGLDIESIKRTAIKRGICREEELATMTLHQIQALIFAPGFSTRTFVTEVSGRGVGLDVVRTNVEHLKGSIHVESAPGKGCTLRLNLGTSLSTAHVLLVAVNDIAYALPVEFVQMARLVAESEIFTIEGRDTIILDGQPISVAPLANLLEMPSLNNNFSKPADEGQEIRNDKQQPCIILKIGEECLGLLVDALLDEQDVVLKPQSKLLQRVRNVAGATILGTGEVCMVLNPQDLIKSVRRPSRGIKPVTATEPAAEKQTILLVEDSIATRTQEKRILESAGYEVVTAVDGLDGYNKLKTRSFDAVVSDIQMPNLDGLGLTVKIRQHKEYKELPIILVTSLATDEDRRIGAQAGANAYITKSTFNQEVLLETLRRLV
ncbi:Hpt domain-containing protein [Microcoleus sp. FACHB-68]|uniref:hybrid sensor histidine kinase/response regulator n=1 Tax=Microcoleus sp. FACHB-68 TaxID=2692826 RepID=UPI001689169B|nr:Hpt domain-containing protein [Microcoleus sp. FACHB-68]MBD1936125.1 Hpt domain-containing protein [Microcoleus sp. FACHB-68]